MSLLILEWVAFAIGAYLIGSIPTGLWLGRAWKGIDVRTQGSGNLGATNVFRVLGLGPGLVTLFVDILKGFLPVVVCLHFYPDHPNAALAIGIATIAGHTMSIFVRFRGGKGVATSAGVFAALLPIPCAIAIAVFGLIFAMTRIVSISSMVAAAILAATSFYFSTDRLLSLAATAIAFFVLWTHRTNLKRLVNGTELPVTRSSSKS